jgi:hypothetical protein
MTASASPPPTFDAARAVLALDTSAGQCSVALRWGPREAYRVAPMIQGHSRVLLGMIDAVMVELGCDATHIAAVGYGNGPLIHPVRWPCRQRTHATLTARVLTI